MNAPMFGMIMEERKVPNFCTRTRAPTFFFSLEAVDVVDTMTPGSGDHVLRTGVRTQDQTRIRGHVAEKVKTTKPVTDEDIRGPGLAVSYPVRPSRRYSHPRGVLLKWIRNSRQAAVDFFQ